MNEVKWRRDYQAPRWVVERIHLSFRLDAARSEVTNRMVVRPRQALAPGEELELFLNGEELDFLGLRVNGREHAMRLTETGLYLNLPGGSSELEIRTAIAPRGNTALTGLYMSGGVVVTQCEAEGFRRITYFPDRPDVLTRFSTEIVADARLYPILLSNGDLVESSSLEGGWHRALWVDPHPKPCYLFALVAGAFDVLEDVFTTREGRRVALRLYTEPGQGAKADFALASLKRAFAWDERRFGLSYDLDTYMVVAVPDFNFGAMENKGLNVFNTKYVLADPAISTDNDFLNVEAVIGHEYFHNWTGNRVTCRDWFQLSLKEGLTVFRDQEFTADLHSRPVKRIQDVLTMRTSQFAEDDSPMAHPVRPDSYIEMNNFYTVTVYNKGAEVIRMMHTLLGEERFLAGMRLYFSRHDGQAVTCDDFVQAMEDASGVDLGRFRLWYSQAGTPLLRVEERQEGERFFLTLSQECLPVGGQRALAPFHIPVRVGFLDERGAPLALALQGQGEPAEEHVLSLTEASQTFTFHCQAKPLPSLLRDFSAPVRLQQQRSLAELALLWGHDPNLFNRWDAGQSAFSRVLRAGVEGSLSAMESLFPELFAAANACLAAAGSDPALIALAICPPDLRTLGEQYQPTIPLQALIAAREHLMRCLGQALAQRALELYHASPRMAGPFPDSSRRSLRNAMLALLCARGQEEDWQLAHRQACSSQNMTDRIAACALLASGDSPLAEEALRHFERDFDEEALAMDKFFAIQAASRRADTFDRVRNLMTHPRMNLANPNKVFALLGTFAANLTRFHQADGAPYEFMADRILELDETNPHLSGRLARQLMFWRRHQEPCASRMRAALQRVAAHPLLSPQVFEITSRSLTEKG